MTEDVERDAVPSRVRKGRGAMGVAVLAAACVLLGWAWGSQWRRQALAGFHPSVYSARIAVADGVTKEPLEFEIAWMEPAASHPKKEEPGKVVDHGDRTKSVVILRKDKTSDYSFDVVVPGYAPEMVTLVAMAGQSRVGVEEDTVRVYLERSGE